MNFTNDQEMLVPEEGRPCPSEKLGNLPKVPRRKYSVETLDEFFRLYHVSMYSISSIAKQLNIHEKTATSWVRKYRETSELPSVERGGRRKRDEEKYTELFKGSPSNDEGSSTVPSSYGQVSVNT